MRERRDRLGELHSRQAAGRWLFRESGEREVKNSPREHMAKGSVETLTQDLRAALRRLRRAPGLSALVVLSLALGIGANSAIFSVARSVLSTRCRTKIPIAWSLSTVRRATSGADVEATGRGRFSGWRAPSSAWKPSPSNGSTGGAEIPLCAFGAFRDA